MLLCTLHSFLPIAARPKKKNATLLSFGEEAEEEEMVYKAAPKLKSAHDATDDRRLAKQHADDLKVCRVLEDETTCVVDHDV